MQTTLVLSSALAKIEYDEPQKLLELEFRDRTIYRYRNVPARIHRELLTSESKGEYFNRMIRGAFCEERLQNSHSLS